MLESINPANEELIHQYEEMSDAIVSGILDKTNSGYHEWKLTSFNHRSGLMKNAAKILHERKEEFAKLMTLEMGKPILQSKAEVEKCAWVCDYYADNAEKFLANEIIKTEFSKSYVSFQPLGVVLAIMPWNFPFWQVFRFAAPTLMAGNASVLKHASNVMGCAIAIEKIFNDAGFLENLFRTLVISSKKVEAVIRNKNVQAVTLTGSTPAGSTVASVAGSEIKKTVLELGGSDPYIILEDVDLESAAEICVNARLINSGQSCIAAKRFIVVEEIYKMFEELFVQKMKSKKMGNPLDESNHLGPQARTDLRNELHDQVKRSITKGAKLLLGGEIPNVKGAYYPPTVLSNISPGMPAYDDEIFGPVASLIKVKNEKEAIKVANATSFGLGAAVFTKDNERGEKIAEKELVAGSCFVNDSVRSDPRLPFGGVKESGYGRELSVLGIREFVNIKTVCRK
ncbi:MAG: succinate-semialdehyde dehydrogenase [Ignavibacteria bacterium RIFOXYB2_FULL_35_12]|nr:MAG: succinate-semialdehyde dehydrogenase [Ignavibacteria bacterium GWA2_36_19]OGU61305.1 MAG: succinate-semialdehyde dehydrogenase [Ignavibacteria bacterium GWF2_35_20]OGU88484.1 MAG: succinate-semialdehyde dehydrogenase [Ignavibacteria bacterium RIFOXYA12_FULL_35_25]OGU92431.1 MAG: succinate-semialdehyde dehydrogenase [Ignavibacteria bacterium RIFOXYC12_FULL_35_11]OGU95808.1 MAG: succinate-semialdehyde dehydrogenase [Ignavibacteria bacterium RIFOXYB12_FULL_35_14]OGV00954.1 MAG: succinate-